ncbi:hypothetical protein D3C87_504810 [compost metagenome]
MKSKIDGTDIYFLCFGFVLMLATFFHVGQVEGGPERYVVFSMPIGMIAVSLLSILKSFREQKYNKVKDR